MSHPELENEWIKLESVQAAAQRIAPYLHRTPLVHSSTLSRELGANVYLKLECLQKTGSFKPRGAFNKLLTLSQSQRDAGVVGVSGGNHAQGLAFASATLGVKATICMPSTTPSNYVDATRGYGADIHFTPTIHEAFAAAVELEASGRTLVHPFDDLQLAAGQGTVGLEIIEDLPKLSRLYVSIGGGGLIAGVAAAIKATHPHVKIIGVETHGADAMAQSVAAGELVELKAITSIARTLGAPKVSHMTFDHVRKLVDELIVVDDQEAIDAMLFLLERTKTLVEPAASCCLAAVRRQRDTLQPDEHVALLMCGGNVSVADLCRFADMKL